ncbi:MAG: threonine aldolase family protein [Paracoccaceae bacterium]
MHDFYSDTQTRPSRAMREACLDAPVGDEQGGHDPTTRALEERAAALLGKEDAVFLPSGTMANQIALMVHCRPGDQVICERQAHLIFAEGGGPAANAGVILHPVEPVHGIFTPEQVAEAINPPSRYAPRSRLLSIEQTANLAGGAVWPVATLDAVCEVAHAHGLATHMDGARLLNAAVASGLPARDHAAGFDSVWLDLSKGLGCPVGAVLAGSREFIHEAWQHKQRLGGAMRQSGILAAMGLYALEHNIDRLAEDHALAREIGQRLSQMPAVAGLSPVESNIVILDLAEAAGPAPKVAERLAERDVRVSVMGKRIRVVTHMDVGRQDAEALYGAFDALV